MASTAATQILAEAAVARLQAAEAEGGGLRAESPAVTLAAGEEKALRGALAVERELLGIGTRPLEWRKQQRLGHSSSSHNIRRSG